MLPHRRHRYLGLAALLLTAACQPTAGDRAQQAAQRQLTRLLGQPVNLHLHAFPQQQLAYYTTEGPVVYGNWLATYTATVAGWPQRQVALVDRLDSVWLFVPDWHEVEFAKEYGVNYRTATLLTETG